MNTTTQTRTPAEVPTDAESDLPDGWVTATLADCVEILDHLRVPVNSKEREGRQGSIPYYGATGQVGWIDDYLFDEELLLLGEDGAPFLDKSKPIAYVVSGRSWINNHAHVLRALVQDTSNRFLKYLLDFADFSDFVTGTTRLKLTQGDMRRMPVLLPPLPEQKRIVVKIEQLFKQVNASRAFLAKVPKILKRFRQSVLAAACSGHLTENWRETEAVAESSQQFLKRVCELRRQAWQEKKFDRAKRNYPNPDDVDTTDLPDLPESWEWASAGAVCSQITDGEHIQPPYQSEGRPMLSAKHVRDGFVTLEGAGLISEPDFRKALERCQPEEGNILIVSVGATTGRSAIVEYCLPFAIVRSVLLLKPLIPARFFLRWVQSPWCFTWMTQASGASTQPHLYIKDTKRMPVPIASLPEQQEIVRRVEALFKLADLIEKRVEAATKRADKLTQAILAKAFRGELVPTEAGLSRREGRDYEPASVLLERIRADRERSATTKRDGKRPRRVRTRKE